MPEQLSKPETLVTWSSTIYWRYLLNICGHPSGDVGSTVDYICQSLGERLGLVI